MKLFYLVMVASILFGCEPVTYVQLFKTKNNSTLASEKGSFVYENDTLKITYDFWAERGKMGFTVYNKLNVPLYLDWRKSSFICGDEKADYWRDIETIDAAGVSVTNTTGTSEKLFTPTITLAESAGAVTYGTIKNVGVSTSGATSVSKAIRTKEERIIFIAPRVSIKKEKFALFPVGVLLNKENIIYGTTPNSINPKKTTVIPYREYEPDESILIFRNFLSFSTNENFTNEFYVDNSFYVSRVSVIETKHFDGSWNSQTEYNYGSSKNFYVHLSQENSNYYYNLMKEDEKKKKQAAKVK